VTHQKHPIDVTVSDSGTAGPTAFIVGGMHGDEEAGIIAAHNITGWEPTAGQIAVLPEANPVAIEQNARGTDRGDLNRKFDVGQPPATALAQAIWQAVTAANPDVLIALHESTGIYEGTPPGVGQAIFCSPGEDTDDAASMAIRRANRTIGRQELKFDIGHVTGPKTAPTGLLTEKAPTKLGFPRLSSKRMKR
jgi:predicted deacylase